MTTTVEAPRLLAEATGESVAAVEAVARTLRPALYPVSSKGGGRGLRHLGPEHLTALTFGLALHRSTRSPAADLSRLVITFTQLGVRDTDRWLANLFIDPNKRKLLLQPMVEWRSASDHQDQQIAMCRQKNSSVTSHTAVTAGAAFAALIDFISQPEGNALRETLRVCGADVDLMVDVLPEVVFFLHQPNKTFSSMRFDRLTRGMFVGQPSPAAIMRSARIRFALIEVLADAWANTRLKTNVAVSAFAPPPPS